MKCDLTILTETRTNSWWKDIWEATQTCSKFFWSFSRIMMASVPDKNSTNYQPGGSLSILTGNLYGRVIDAG